MTGRLPSIALLATLAIALVNVPAASQPQQVYSGRLVIEGTGDSQELMSALARRFEALNPGVSVDIPSGTGSRGGIIAVIEGKAELARVSRPPTENEKSSGVAYKVFAQSPVVFAVNPNERLSGLSSEQIAGIYSGKYVNWKQLGGTASQIYPLGRESTDPSRMAVGRIIPGFGQVKNPVSKTYYTTSALVEAIERHPGTVGYAPMAMVKKTGLKVLKVDGVYPLIMNVKNGTYRMVIPLGIVHGEKLSPAGKAFVDFLNGPEAQKIIIQFECVPAGR